MKVPCSTVKAGGCLADLHGVVCQRNAFLIFQELLLLEEDVKNLEEMYPQGEKVMVDVLVC